jgi:hypothetical protein
MSKHLAMIAAAAIIACSGTIAIPTHVAAGGAQAKTLTPPTAGKRRTVLPNALAISEFSSSSAIKGKSKSKPNR